ncbi:Protein Lines 1 [Liparis tanakae]|uniref:Protein Lines 1 n=1 Tax=Liparis tanakae TaxID=230148 RepID=A0A4Z2IB67_9TELE|nr:Protein Lines 1 [Liparis tanakae]
MAGPHGRGSSIMEREASSREPLDSLADVYRCFQRGSCPGQSAADAARLISSGVCGLVPGEDGARSPSARSVELSCLALSLVERITSSLASGSLSPAAASYYVEVLEVLFQDMGLMSHLMDHFQAEDQIISHLAAKTVSTCVCYQLQQSDTISPVWQQKCEQAFYSSALGPELDSCLWSLTEILKRLLKGAHQADDFGKLLAALDSSLSALCSTFLPGERTEGTRSVDLSSCRRWGTASCLLLDLLEVLTASSVIRGGVACLESQRITHVRSSALLATVSGSAQYFVKKRALLLLKRAALQKAGEEWALGDAPPAGPRHEHFHADADALARSVLTAVAADWLQSVQVESASFFGGTRRVEGEDGQTADCVTLRAVSLLLLKSMELHIQSSGATAGAGGAAEVYGYLHRLWGFLRRCSVQLTEVSHRCCWVSLLFGDQDDDMMEAAKALFSIFIQHRLCSGLDDSAVLEAACSSGCNPHCHFLLLLQSISFDHSILLDFLISTETCFLEYFVRYLKYLRADWRGFAAACGRIGLLGGHRSAQRSLTGGGTSKVTCKGEPDRVEVGSSVQLTGVIPLVDYDSSDQSDPESMEVSPEEPGPSVCETSKFCALDVKQKMSGSPMSIEQQYESSASKPLATREGSSLSSCPAMSGRPPCKTLARAVLCMSELREVVARLQTRKLFPYNPSSLLKLLAQVENCS